MVLPPGTPLGAYRILSALGAGGMGEVYRAHDPRLGRDVAIKVVDGEGADPRHLRRVEEEARAVAAIDHPHILSVHDVGREGDRAYIVFELLEGETLRARLEQGPLAARRACELALEISEGLAAAHARGIVHRDLKPENLFLTESGRIKILDFGLAKPSPPAGEGAPSSSTPTETTPGTILGTVGYMSPEQARGLPADARSDLFAFGAIVYEMLSGRRAFSGATAADVLSAVLLREPAEIPTGDPLTEGLARVAWRCLEKEPERRFQSAQDVAFALEALAGPRAAATTGATTPRRAGRPWRLVVASAAALALLGVAAWYSRSQWARNEAIPEAVRLAGEDRYVEAFDLARRAERLVPGDPRLRALWPRVSTEISIVTIPAGASVSSREYAETSGAWRPWGRTPLEKLRHPQGYFRWRFDAPGHGIVERAGTPGVMEVKLPPESEVPAGMVRVPGGETMLFVAGFAHLPRLTLGDYWIDRYEVTNREFQRFVAAGGYTKREYWTDALEAGRPRLAWSEVAERFRDATGRAGPAAWELGSYPAGQGDLPVTGVSWFEASAYAAYAEKTLPTIYHWFHAAGLDGSPWTVAASNYAGKGLAGAGVFSGLGAAGTLDMAGNAREWCANATSADGGQHYILGGAWNEPAYMFARAFALSPLDRSPTNGFRGMRVEHVSPAEAWQFAPPIARDFAGERPVPDGDFRLLRSLYAYDRGDPKPEVESERDLEKWRVQRVSYDAAYDGERIPAYLLLPKTSPPPYQTVVYFPGGNAFMLRTQADFDLQLGTVDFLAASGRAVLFPIYAGSYERGRGPTFDPWTATPGVWRDYVLRCAKDFGRSIDYLETRQDVDHGRLAYLGVSRGAALGSLLPAIEDRLKAAVLVSGGFYPVPARPEVDLINFAPRVTIPVLMINGRYDFLVPEATSQRRMFELLGTPSERKKLVLLDMGHELPPRHRLIRETVDWLDRYLGPVATGP